MRRLLSLFAAGLSLLASACSAQTDPQVLELIRSGDRVLIDVRTPGEFDAGHLKGATRISYEQIDQYIGSIAPDKQTPVVLYCRSGNRAGVARQTLEQMGYQNVINAGGYNQLQNELGNDSCRPQVNC